VTKLASATRQRFGTTRSMFLIVSWAYRVDDHFKFNSSGELCVDAVRRAGQLRPAAAQYIRPNVRERGAALIVSLQATLACLRNRWGWISVSAHPTHTQPAALNGQQNRRPTFNSFTARPSTGTLLRTYCTSDVYVRTCSQRVVRLGKTRVFQRIL